jgi:hypothetical protein
MIKLREAVGGWKREVDDGCRAFRGLVFSAHECTDNQTIMEGRVQWQVSSAWSRDGDSLYIKYCIAAVTLRHFSLLTLKPRCHQRSSTRRAYTRHAHRHGGILTFVILRVPTKLPKYRLGHNAQARSRRLQAAGWKRLDINMYKQSAS